jgi:hypothetical protein
MSDEISCEHQIKDSETLAGTNRQQGVVLFQQGVVLLRKK